MTDFADQPSPALILLAALGLAPSPELMAALETVPYNLYPTCNPAKILAAAQERSPEIILIFTPGFGQAEADICQTLHQHPQTRWIPLLVMGQDQDPMARVKAFEAGIMDYILADLCPAEVIARVQVHINQYRLLQRLSSQAQRAITAGNSTPLLANLQRALRQQAERLQAQNDQLQREMQQREKAQQALRLEQQKSEQLLLNILPRAIVEKLKQIHGSLAQRFDDVTILFADIVNFTPLAAQTNPLELVDWLNKIFSEFDRLADRYRLEKIKTIGDAYMVVGGLPLPMGDHAQAVMEMALAMQAAADRITRSDGQAFQLRIGMNTGAVVAGVIGIRKFSYDLWGDAVNIASRMESQGTPGKIQVTEATYQRIQHLYEFEAVGQVLVKGRGYVTSYQYVKRKAES